jgi:hypothetical protein
MTEPKQTPPKQPENPSTPPVTPEEHDASRTPKDSQYHGGRDPDPSKS